MNLNELHQLRENLNFFLGIVDERIKELEWEPEPPEPPTTYCYGPRPSFRVHETANLIAKTPAEWASIDWLHEHITKPTELRWGKS